MTWLQLARRFWWAVPMLALAAGLVATRGRLADVRATLAAERAAWSDEVARADRQRNQAERDFAQAVAGAADTYAARLAAREPIIVQSTREVREYAATPAGRALCRDADRVRSIDLLDAQLATAPITTDGGASPVPPEPAEPTAGR